MSKNQFDFNDLLLSNTERYVALRSLTIGMCAFTQKCLQTVISYQNLLIDELEQQQGPAGYSRKSRQLSELMLQAVQELRQAFPGSTAPGERLNLAGFCEGMAGQFDTLSCELPDEPEGTGHSKRHVNADAFLLQQLFVELCELLQEKYPQSKWRLQLEEYSFQPHEREQLGLNAEKEHYLGLGIVAEGMPEDAQTGLAPLLDFVGIEQESFPFSAQQMLRWAGVLLAQGGNLLFNPKTPKPAVLFLFPVCDASKSGELDYLAYDPENNNKTILLVDDEDMIWDVISAMLQDLGYRVILAENGREAVEIYQNNPGMIDLVLLDMIMPTMSGTEAFFLLKKMDPKVKVLLSSGYVSEDEVQEVLKAGAAGFLRKPYHMADLAKKARQILSAE
ncbi:MAG: response regulator [Lentisphaeria bacterium]|nr:response regulator [Lentisphaerota bacterium]